MAMPMQDEHPFKLRSFIDFVSTNPTVLNMPQLKYVKDFIEKFGGKVPEGEFKPEAGKCPFADENEKPAPSADPIVSDESAEDESTSEPESDVELDMEGVIEADSDPAQPMGDSGKTPTEEEIDQAGDLRAQAAGAYSEQKFDEAIGFYTKAIELNPGNALFHAKRGQAFLKLKKPNACIRDCDKALELNCDSAAAYKFRGRAHRLLGQFEEAAKDLRQACKLDFDEEADEWLREVTPNAKKIEQHRIKLERKQAERKMNDRKRAQRKAGKGQEDQPAAAGGEFPGAFGDPLAGFDVNGLLSNLKDPEVMAAAHDIMANPANISKYMSNPKIFNSIKKFFPGQFPACFADADPKAGGADNGAGASCDADGGAKAPNSSEPKAKKESPGYVDDGLD
ncbi:hsc70-interacting protein 1 [Drosophila grimshawi]|uniref:GH24750 n=1 Tax=Drosophila grimshawi TaxID=7222 RepID=B4JN56_DROGR|nr:hsc70-interacting protein 1 [Drosophila grimshawi]EDV92149.1 GH24750 [Drosophila grimshawi]